MNELKWEVVMLESNISRMTVTKDEKELERMRYQAKCRIDKIAQLRLVQLSNELGGNHEEQPEVH